MDSYKLKFKNGRSCTIECDTTQSFQDKINECEVRFNSECISINGKPIKKHSLGGFLVGATIGGLLGNSVPLKTVSKTAKGVKRTTKKVVSSVKKQVKKFGDGGTIYNSDEIADKMESNKALKPFANKVRALKRNITESELDNMLPDYISGKDIHALFNKKYAGGGGVEKTSGYHVVNLGGDLYDGGVAYEIYKDGNLIDSGLIDGEWGLDFQGKHYDGLVALSKDLNAKLTVNNLSQMYAEGGVITFDDGYQFKEVSEDYARKNWKNEEIYAINLDDQTERVIESEDDIDSFDLFGVEMGQKKSGFEDYKELMNHALKYLSQKYPNYTDAKVGELSDIEYNDIFFEMVDDLREEYELGEDNDNFANTIVEEYMSSGKYAGGGRTPTRKYAISGGGLAEEYIVEAKNKDEAIEKAQRTLKTVFGRVPKSHFSYRVVGKFGEGGGIQKQVYYEVGIDMGEDGTRTIADFDTKKEAERFVYEYSLEHPKAKLFIDNVTSEYLNKFAGGGSTGYNRSWHFDHDRHNKSESYEVPLADRKKYGEGGGVEKAPRWWNKQVRGYEFFVFNTETNKVWAGNEYLNDAKDELKEFLLNAPTLPLKVLSKRAITNKKINPLAYENWARSSEQFATIEASYGDTDKFGEGGGVNEYKVVLYKLDKYDNWEEIDRKQFESIGKAMSFAKEKHNKGKGDLVEVLQGNTTLAMSLGDEFVKMYENGGMSSMAVAGAMPELAIADQISQRLPETTSAIDKKLAERIYSNQPKWYEDRGMKYDYGGLLQVGDMVKIIPNYASIYTNDKGQIVEIMPDNKTYLVKIRRKGGNEFVKWDRSDLIFLGNEPKYANGGMIGKEITFDRWGEERSGTITEVLPDGNFTVSSGMGSYLVEPDKVISFSAQPTEKRGWFFAQGGSTPYNYSWHFDHDRHNKSESYEVPLADRKKFGEGGGVEKDIARYKKQLISKAKSKGLYENFGQDEVEKLEDKYGYSSEVASFDNWAMNFDLSQLKSYADGGKTEQRYIILSPDGFPIYRDKTFTESEILPAFEEWKKRYEQQGYYSMANRERLDLRDLGDMCSVIEVDEDETED